MNGAPIYVTVTSDDLMGKFKAAALAEDPNRKPCPIVWETQVNGATLARETERAAALERQGYGACRVARLVFDADPQKPQDMLDALRQWRAAERSGDAQEMDNARAARDAAIAAALGEVS